MATAAPSPLASSVEKTNGSKLSRLLIDGGTAALRKVFDHHHPPANLVADLNTHYSILYKLRHRRILNSHQWDTLFPPNGAVPDSNTFDISLLFLLLTNVCGLSPPLLGWHTKPPPSDTSLEDNLARVKCFRNVLYGHVTSTSIDTPTFSALWQEISVVLVALGLDQAEIDRLKAEKGGEEDYLDVIRKWADSEEDIQSQLKNMYQCQSKTYQTVEDLRQTQNKTHEIVEEAVKTHVKHYETLEAGLQEVKEAVGSFKEERDRDRADEVLRKLAKSEFKGDIEYYVERFQVGTREWVFNRVQNWLDDKPSQNRVMVISGNAGMGKSVIAAVICKRMQQAGRLVGSHFCQHDNVHYRNPQLILQSLACHLCHFLPEYKQALVERLSRNLGGDLNKMGVKELFALLFKEPLSTVGDPGRNMLMVIDGLDESEYQGRSDLLDMIANQFCKLPSWIRVLVTARPATNITDKLNHLKPFQLQSNDEKNLGDIKIVLEKRLQLSRQENVDAIVEDLVRRSEGLMLYVHFILLYIKENASVLKQGDLDGSLPLGIASVYQSYFKRLESELMKELDIKEEHFLNLLRAVTASREPLPTDFVPKLLVPSRNSPLAKRKVLKAIGSVSSLLPIRNGCLHVIHRSVKDWLIDISCYGEHEFTINERECHRILAGLCTDELDGLKRRGVHDKRFSDTEKYALNHGARHVFHSDEERNPCTLEELTKAYVMDLELVYAKLCVNNTRAAEEFVWLQKQGISTVLSEDIQSIIKAMLFLLRKYHDRFREHPRKFFQTVLNKGGAVLSHEASILLQDKYPEIPYMEYVHKEEEKGRVLVRFQCSSEVACFDISRKLDYMVCECKDGMLQLWSLHTGSLEWERPVKVIKSFWFGAYRKLSSVSVVSFFRSVVFHPTEDLVLPGILSHAYTTDGDLKPLFLESTCRFSVCSISGDKTKLLTDCRDDPKCLVMWSLKDGSEIDRITSDEDVLTFAWSRDGTLLAISHITGLICLVAVANGVRTRTLARMVLPEVCGLMEFSPDHRYLFCFHSCNPSFSQGQGLFRFNVHIENCRKLHVSSDRVSYDPWESESFSDSGFLLGDPIPCILKGSRAESIPGLITFDRVFSKRTLLRGSPNGSYIQMLNTSEATPNRETKRTEARSIALSLDGQTVYVATDTVLAWDVSSRKIKGQTNAVINVDIHLAPVREGVLFNTISNTLELWSSDLSECIRIWTNFSRITEMYSVSEERVACVQRGVEVNFVDANSGNILSTIPIMHRRAVACNSNCQLITVNDSGALQLLDHSAVLWEKKIPYVGFSAHEVCGMFSPGEQLVAIWRNLFDRPVYVLDAAFSNTTQVINTGFNVHECKFVSNEACLVSCSAASRKFSLRLFNIKSGDLLTVMEIGSVQYCLAACPNERLLAIGLVHSLPNFKVIRVCVPGDKDSRKSKQ